jgi:hypothetical protein
MAGLMLRSGISSLLPMGTSVQARREVQVAGYSRGRGGEPGAGFHPAN